MLTVATRSLTVLYSISQVLLIVCLKMLVPTQAPGREGKGRQGECRTTSQHTWQDSYSPVLYYCIRHRSPILEFFYYFLFEFGRPLSARVVTTEWLLPLTLCRLALLRAAEQAYLVGHLKLCLAYAVYLPNMQRTYLGQLEMPFPIDLCQRICTSQVL